MSHAWQHYDSLCMVEHKAKLGPQPIPRYAKASGDGPSEEDRGVKVKGDNGE